MEDKKEEKISCHKTSIGGQAVIEGVMMRGPKKLAVAIRKPDNEIILKEEDIKSLSKKYKFLKLPFLRGILSLVESLFMGTRILNYSAEFYEEETNPSFLDKIFKDRAEDVSLLLTVIIAFLMSIGLFMFIPTLITNFFSPYIRSNLLLNLIEGLVRLTVFFIYLVTISKMDDIERIFQYHGAEHKSIHCYEAGEDLTVENARNKSALHPRCGTSFLFTVMIISIVLLSFFGWPNPIERLINRLIMFPVITGISYEVNRIIARSNSKLSTILSYPGLGIQKLATVKEPDDSQLEVALLALKSVITGNKEDDQW